MDRYFHGCHFFDPGSDFYQIYYAAKHLSAGKSIFQTPFDPVTEKYHPTNMYPPLVIASIGIPLSILSPETAYKCWVVIHELLMLILLVLTYRVLSATHYFQTAALGLLLIPPVYYNEIYLGQMSFILAAMIFFMLFFFHRGSRFLCGMSWVIATQLKLIPLIFLPVFWRKKKFSGFIAANIGIILISFAIYWCFHPPDFFYFISTAFSQKPKPAMNIMGVINGLTRARWVQWFVTLTVLSFCITETLRKKRADFIALISFWMFAELLVYSRTWSHHFLLALPVIMFSIAGSAPFRRLWLASGFLLLTPPPDFLFMSNITLRHHRTLCKAVYHSVFLIILFMLSCLYVRASHARNSAEGEKDA